jgi:DeoR family transcriptional regulator of aga operon
MAARLILDNQSLVFDSGSTLLLLAMQMPPVNNVVVATTAMNIAQHLMYRPGLDVHMIGGRVFPNTVSTIVSDFDKAVGGLVAHQAFVSAHAIDQAFDVVDVSEDIARTKRNLVRMARRVILVADSSKWDIGASSKAFSLSRVDLIITDSDMPYAIRGRLEKLGVEVRYA